ncbi:PAS domain-containing sensor histidine kinase [Methylobacterium haplocladii]|uniref:histidine kinase n=1 Tax=Methylobacterium haplocladii TaxID=1176176 RepID=A0A512IUJ2_9HYPH|nr:PAS domain-containing sensor histidine kinase [Methylobacterium haplocladii]GLS58258.1 PAS domain-containing sensor histidine kinase [Methylobacterium haplocladii]
MRVVSLRIDTTLATLFDARLAGLVHDSALEEPGMRFRHERFLVSRLATGAVMMAALPPYLLWRGVPSGIEALGVASLFLPVLAAAVLSRTGILWIAHALSSAGLTGVVVCLAALTGGSSSAAALWLVAIPLEALVSGSIRATVAAALIAALGALAVAFSGQFDLTAQAIGWPSAIAMPLFAITAIGHISAQAIEHLRREGEWRARMRDNEARDRLLLSAIDDLVTWHDANGRVLEASASAAKFVGVEPGRLRGLGLLDRVHIHDRPALLKAISDVAASGEPVTVPFRLHLDTPSADGSRAIFAEMRAHRIEAGLGGANAATVVAVTRDVSEHHRHAAELDKARADAERADAVKSRFLATVSHELRTPLNAIIGFSEVLGGAGACTLTAERSKEYADIIANSGRHLLGVVNTLLDMSRIQSGHFEFEPEALDVGELVAGCCDLMQLKVDDAGIRLVRGVIPHGSAINADARACRQVLINLISNAVKFTPKGGRIEVGVRRGASYLDLVVSDTGSGIAEADLPRIGDPFFQANGGYERAHEGTGLGLSVVRGLVGLHGGSISIESAPGRGTTVSVTLPLDPRRSSTPSEPAPIRTAIRGAAPASGPAPTVVRLPIGLFDDETLPSRESAMPLKRAG